MHVVATAGHVDHGKSTLVRALTGTEPDRWAEERRRGLTIDLGFAWLTLSGGAELGFVDVPGHQRFIGNMLAGLGPAPAVMFVVAADEGWGRQSTDHLAAIDALGLDRGLLVVTRSDLAEPAPALEEARERLARTSLGTVEAVAVSGRTGEGLPDLRGALRRLVDEMPAPVTGGRVRLWVDRAFTIRGSGTVVTGTLGAGTLRAGDELEIAGAGPLTRAGVRSLQSKGGEHVHVCAVARVAVNLRGVPVEDVHRGDALLTPDTWHRTDMVDVRLTTGEREAAALPTQLVLHVGAAAVPVHLRPLAGDTARLTLGRLVPLVGGDRAILRDPGRQSVAAGLAVLDVDPPALRRRGAARQRAEVLARTTPGPDLVDELARRGHLRRGAARALGIPAAQLDHPDPEQVRTVGVWFVHAPVWRAWGRALTAAVRAYADAHPLEPAMPMEAARQEVGVPGLHLVPDLAESAGLVTADGRVSRPGGTASLGEAETAVQQLEVQLAVTPFAAPERGALKAAGLGRREVAAAVRAGRLLLLGADIVLLPDAPGRAESLLAHLPQPFTTSQARQALATSRRVAIPLLEHLDATGRTRRIDAGHREVRDGQDR